MASAPGTDTQPPAISVVVCTYNRAELLVDALQSLCEQTLDSSEYEVIIVDNNSTDGTRAVAERFAANYGNVRYCLEPRQNLSYARNRGWQEARGDYVGYIDDDGRAPAQWLAVAKGIIKEIAPAVFGGPFYPFYNTPKPRWFKDTYGSHEHGNRARALGEREYLDGLNMFLRRTLLEAGQGFDPAHGMTGDELRYGDETAWMRQIREEIPDILIYYDPDLYIHHLVPARKMNLRGIMRHRFVHGRYAYLVFRNASASPRRLHSLAMLLRSWLALWIDLARGVLARDRATYPYPENYWFERAFRHVQALGWQYEQYRTTFGVASDRPKGQRTDSCVV
jgi:glycosyltransferase involved in cell wall biosynthesis